MSHSVRYSGYQQRLEYLNMLAGELGSGNPPVNSRFFRHMLPTKYSGQPPAWGWEASTGCCSLLCRLNRCRAAGLGMTVQPQVETVHRYGVHDLTPD